jgi:hypothetical protein
MAASNVARFNFKVEQNNIPEGRIPFQQWITFGTSMILPEPTTVQIQPITTLQTH